ncbi:O-antigen ligase [Thalassospira sp.]|uniref:O-antigen ligase family protein n=1 Tax=Thalassospira sp. TaxID=1912094 RepID=UPI0027374152|nr:O-antigen ligase family protein [Thalassospira sp.]MDP2699178.1 O-antigen ligase family protein [Thalassospira sp.]
MTFDTHKSPFARWSHLIAFGLLCAVPPLLLFARAGADIAVVLVGLIFLTRSAVNKDWAWAREIDILILLGIWVILNLLVSPFAYDIERSFGRSLSWLRFIVFYVAVTRWLLVDKTALKIMIGVMLVTVTIATADAAFQFFSGHSALGGQQITGRLTGPLDRPNIGIYLAKIWFAALTLAFAFRLMSGDKKLLGICLGLAPFVLTIIFLSGERTASVLTVGAIICSLIGLFLVGGISRIIAIATGTVCAGGLILLVSMSDRIAARLQALSTVLSDYSESIYGELVLLGWKLFTENPVTGIGMGNFGRVCPPYHAQGLIAECQPHPHNFYIEWLSDTGILGTLPFLVFVAVIVFAGLRRIRPGHPQTFLAGLYIGTLALSLFPLAATQSAFSNWPAIVAWTSISCAVAALRSLDTQKS